MILNDKLLNELMNLDKDIHKVCRDSNITVLELETFLRNFEKRRYHILNQIKLYNTSVEDIEDKIKTISDEYIVKLENGILQIYIPETMPNYKRLKTHTYKNILLNISEKTKPYSGIFEDDIFIFIKVFDTIANWDIDNRFIKPIPDSLILSGVIKDDNINKMFYAVRGYYTCDNPHTEVYIGNGKSCNEIIEKYS